MCPLWRVCQTGTGGDDVDLGNHVSAAEAAEKLAQLKVADEQPAARGLNLYNAACLLSLAFGAAAKDEDVPETERSTLVQNSASRAMELLAEARTAGWFQEAKNIAHVKDTDGDLDPLRDGTTSSSCSRSWKRTKKSKAFQSGAQSGAHAAQNPAQQAHVRSRSDPHKTTQAPVLTRAYANLCDDQRDAASHPSGEDRIRTCGPVARTRI